MRLVRIAVVLLILIGLASQAARFLWVDDPQKSDAIVVLGGETALRTERGLELLRHGMAQSMWIDVVARDRVFDQSLVEIAQRYAKGLPESDRVRVCALQGLSTYAEAEDVKRCLQPLGIHRVVIVTSGFHTRRALMIFRNRLPEYKFSAAAVHDRSQYGTAWWTNREWAKATLDEWMKVVWWETVDRWRASG
jgi:uncharacterized SAM-binding protein YcdF (DUF218 family)